MSLQSQYFLEKLEARVASIGSLLCVGIDPEKQSSPEALYDYCVHLIGITLPFAAAFKFNSAFFEAQGTFGLATLQELLRSIPADVPLILDCKRGDISHSAECYATAAYDVLGADAVTVNPYLGWDTVAPFASGLHRDKCAFILCKTSNPSSMEIQDLLLESGNPVFLEVVRWINHWRKSAALGVVVGGTDVHALGLIRSKLPDTWILCPGVGYQGSDLMDVCDFGLRRDGSGLLVAVSREISRAENPASIAAMLVNNINEFRRRKSDTLGAEKIVVDKSESLQRQMLQLLLSTSILQFGVFTLKSGRQSPYFFNFSGFCSGKTLQLIGRLYAKKIRSIGLEFSAIFGPAYKGIPIATAVATAWYELFGESKAVIFDRKERKEHGEEGNIVGDLCSAFSGGQCRIIIVDDVITAGTAISSAIRRLQTLQESSDFSIFIDAIVVAIDREEVTDEDCTHPISASLMIANQFGIPVHSILPMHVLEPLLVSDEKLCSEVAGIAGLNTSDLVLKIREYRSRYGVM